jgi:hypothetical protein
MKWAAFEETIGSIDEAREILRQLVAKYPMLLEARYDLSQCWHPGCLSRIRIFPSRIQGQKGTGSQIGIPNKGSFLTIKVVTKLSEI